MWFMCMNQCVSLHQHLCVSYASLSFFPFLFSPFLSFFYFLLFFFYLFWPIFIHSFLFFLYITVFQRDTGELSICMEGDVGRILEEIGERKCLFNKRNKNIIYTCLWTFRFKKTLEGIGLYIWIKAGYIPPWVQISAVPLARIQSLISQHCFIWKQM